MDYVERILYSGIGRLNAGTHAQRSTNNACERADTGLFALTCWVSTTFEDEYLVRLEKGASGAIGTGAPVRIVSMFQLCLIQALLEERQDAH